MYRLPSGALWMLVFTAVLGHLPGLAFDLARHDFEGLARAAGLDPTGAWSPRAWTDLAVWSVWWRIGGTDPSVPHGFSVLLVALDALLVALVAARLGIPRAGAILASALWLMGAQTGLAVASATAAADLWALGFALGGLLLWLGERPRRDPPLGAFLLVLSLASGGLALLLPAAFWYTWRSFGFKSESETVRRGRIAILAMVTLAGAASWLSLRGVSGPETLRVAENWTALHQLGSAAWLWPSIPAPRIAWATGAVVALGGLALLALIRHKPAPRVRFALLWTAATLLPALALPELELSTGALAPAVGLAWTAGALLGEPLERTLQGLHSRVSVAGALSLVLLLLSLGPGWALLRADALGKTDASGQLAHPALREAGITAGVRSLVESVMESPAPPDQIAFLQATRTEIPEDLELPEGQELIVASPVHQALAGASGPRLMVAGRATVRWTTLLDTASPDAFVLLDVGDQRVRPLGPVENARMYAALIAVAAGQFDLARHELWSVIEMQGAEVRFAFDPDHLPITPVELDAEASDFARWLRDQGSAASLRVLRLFASVYESVRGQPLIEEGWGGPLRSGRVDD
jgi:hypothetical protein